MSRVLAEVIKNSNKNGTVRLMTSDGKFGLGRTEHKLKKGDKVVANVTLPYPRRTYYFIDIEKIIG